MHLSLRTLRYAIAVAEFGNITQASRSLGISQPSLSAAIAAVETEVGSVLFLRHHARGVTLTAAGRSFIDECQRLMAHVRRFEETVGQIGSEVRGTVSLGCFGTLAIRYLPRILAEFAELMPEISIRLEEDTQEGIIAGIKSGHLELAIGYDYGVPEDLEARCLMQLPPYVLLPGAHPLAAQSRISLRALAPEPYILLDLPMTRDYFTGLFAEIGVEPQITYRSKSFELIRGLVGQNRGYTIHNALPETSETYDGRHVIARPILENLPSAGITLLHLKSQELRPAAKVFSNFVAKYFETKSGILAS